MPGVVNEGILKQYIQDLERSSGFFLTECKGLSVSDADKFRRDLFAAGGHYRVVKNRLFKIALKHKNIEAGLDASCVGSTAIVFFDNKPVDAAKVVNKLEKDVEIFKIKGGYFEGQTLTKKDVKDLASIPSREVLLTKLVICLNGPLTGLVTALSGVLRNTVGVLNAIKDKKDKEGKGGA